MSSTSNVEPRAADRASLRPADWGLYLVTDRSQTGGRELERVVAEALAGGVRAVQLRAKDLPADEYYRLALSAVAATRAAGAALLVNDRVDVAMATGADGVHLTRRSLPPADARRLLGRERLLGISCHSVEDVEEAVAANVDFVVLGPIYATPSKAGYGPPLGLGLLRDARRLCPLPLIAIGGITAGRVAEVVAAGADGVAAISAVLAAPDPAGAARAVLDAFTVARARAGRRP